MPIPPSACNDDVRRLLGLAPTAKAINEFVSIAPTKKAFKECTYHSYKSEGLSLCFDHTKAGDLELNEIHIYNDDPHHDFKPCKRALPLELTAVSQAKDIVNRWGEPDRKGGGGKTGMPCWIEYQFDDGGGVLVQLNDSVWDDSEMGWSSLVLFR